MKSDSRLPYMTFSNTPWVLKTWERFSATKTFLPVPLHPTGYIIPGIRCALSFLLYCCVLQIWDDPENERKILYRIIILFGWYRKKRDINLFYFFIFILYFGGINYWLKFMSHSPSSLSKKLITLIIFLDLTHHLALKISISKLYH